MHPIRRPLPPALTGSALNDADRKILPPSRPRTDPDALVGLACLLLLPLALLMA